MLKHKTIPIQLLPILLLISGCVTSSLSQWPTDKLIDSVGQNQLADHLRLAVIDQVSKRPLDPNQHQQLGATFSRIVSSPLHSPLIRQRVIQAITQHYRPASPVWLGQALTTTKQPNLRLQIIDTLANINDPRSLPFLTLALTDNNQKQNIAITNAIQKISHQPWQTTLINQLLNNNTSDTNPLPVRITALTYLTKHLGREKIIQIISTTKPNPQDNFLNQLSFWSQQYNYLPNNIISFWLADFQSRQLSPAQLQKLRHLTTTLNLRENYNFDIHDSHLLLNADEKSLKLPRTQLTENIQTRLANRPHTKRPPSYPNSIDDYPEVFIDQCKLLSYTDLLRIRLLLDHLDQPKNIDAIRQVLHDDLADTATETGGLCFLLDNKIIFKNYLPTRFLGDNQYMDPPALVRDAYLCLSRWHCHTDPSKGRDLAGPGSDDIKYAHYVNCPIVILTLLQLNKTNNSNIIFCNIDYLTPQGVVIDLGNY